MSPLAVALDVMDCPWQWGRSDCCTAACDVFQRLHGIDPMSPLRGQYHDLAGATEVIRSHGGFARMVSGLAMRARLPTGTGTAGEIGIVRGPDGFLTLAVCVGPGAWVGKTLTGMATIGHCIRSWHA